MPVGRTVLRVNLDGTAFCLHQGGGVGKISVTKRQCSGAPVESVPLSQRRCYMTHVAFICDHPDLPPHMPQVLVGNEATIPAETLEELNNALPAIVHLLRQRSAWNNAELLVEILKVLKSALVPFGLSGLQMMLLLDAASIHISWVVLRACFRAGICPCSLPAKKTWLLQPLDTHAIWPLKMCVCVWRLHERPRASTADGTVTLREFLDCIATAIRQILQSHRWANAFDANGFGQNQSRLSHLVRRHLQLEGPVSISSSRPAEDQIRACLPRRSRIAPMLLRAINAAIRGPKAIRLGPVRPSAVVPRVAPSSPALASASASLGPLHPLFAGVPWVLCVRRLLHGRLSEAAP